MDYIYYHCLWDLVLLAGGDLQEPNLFHQVQLYSHFPELKCNSLTFNATANCLSKKERGVPPLVIWLFLITQMTQISKFGKCCWDVHLRQMLDGVPMERPHVDTSHFLVSRSHSDFEIPPRLPENTPVEEVRWLLAAALAPRQTISCCLSAFQHCGVFHHHGQSPTALLALLLLLV